MTSAKATKVIADLLKTKLFSSETYNFEDSSNTYLYFDEPEKGPSDTLVYFNATEGGLVFGVKVHNLSGNCSFVHKVASWDLDVDIDVLLEHLDEEVSNKLLYHLNLLS